MKTVDDVLRELKILEIQKESVLNPGETYMNFVIDPDGFNIVEDIIRDFLLEHEKTAEKETMFDFDSKIGEMQGKIFAYEEIIKKSNFAPFVGDNHLQDILLNVQKAIAKYETEKTNRVIPTSRLGEKPFKGETKETTEKETMFYSEFLQSDDFEIANYVYWFDLSGNEVVPNNRNKILKYYKRELGNFKFLIVFVGE